MEIMDSEVQYKSRFIYTRLKQIFFFLRDEI